MQGGSFVPVPLADLLDPETDRMEVRMVDTDSTRFRIAQRYMIRLRDRDFESPRRLEELAAVCGLTAARFREEFERVAKPWAAF
jgi:6-phosphofructokinase 1